MLPEGVSVRRLEMNADDRGVFTEVFRRSWTGGPELKQWNAVSSRARVLRGVHVHVRHHDYLIVLRGRALINLCDLRPGSPTCGARASIEMCEQCLAGVSIPPGVAHGFYFHEPSLHIYSVSHYWDPADELGCHFADPDLGLTWPDPRPLLSTRDEALGPLSALAGRIPPWRPRGPAPEQAASVPGASAAAR